MKMQDIVSIDKPSKLHKSKVSSETNGFDDKKVQSTTMDIIATSLDLKSIYIG